MLESAFRKKDIEILILYESSVGYLNWLSLGVLAGSAITPPFLVWSISKYRVLVRKRKQWS